MECPSCGKDVDDSANFCPTCGTPAAGKEQAPVAPPPPGPRTAPARRTPPPPVPPEPGAEAPLEAPGEGPAEPAVRPPGIRPKTNGWAIASLVMGVLGLTCLFLIGSILAIIFGFIARHDIRRSEGRQTGTGLATAGIVLGVLLLVLTIILAAILIPLSYLAVGPTRTLNKAVDAGGATLVDATLDISKGDLRVSGGASSLMQGTFNYNVTSWRPVTDYIMPLKGATDTSQSTTGTLTVIQPSTGWWHWWQWLHGENKWDIRFGSGIPIDLKVNQSWGTGDLDLAGVDLSALDASSSAGETTVGLGGSMPSLKSVNLGQSAGKLTLTMDGSYPALETLAVKNSAGAINADLTGQWTRDMSGSIKNSAGAITVRLPRGVGVYVTARTSAGSVSANGMDSRGSGVFVNSAYGKSPVTLRISIKNSAGNISLTVE